MKEWTREEIERLVPDDGFRITVKQMMAPDARDVFKAVAVALLQTRLDLETARNDIVDGGLAFNDKVIECSRLRGALERIDKGFYSHKLTIREAQHIIREALKEKP